MRPPAVVVAVRVEHRDSAEVSLLRSQVAFAYELLVVLTRGDDLQEVASLARRGQLDEARAELQRWRQRQPGELPVGDGKPGGLEIPASGKAFLNNLRFLEDNREPLLGQWVALEDGQLLDQDATLQALRERLAKANRLRRGVLVTKVY